MDHRKIVKMTASMLLLMNASQQSITTFADHLDSGQMTEEVAISTLEEQAEDVTMEAIKSEETKEQQETEILESSVSVPSEPPTEPTMEATTDVTTVTEQSTTDSTVASTVGEEVTKAASEPVIPDPDARTVCEIQEVDDQVDSGIFGTSQWRIDQEGILYIDAGTLGETTSAARAPWFPHRSLISKKLFLLDPW